ncbi:uncharacterized protein LOC128225798 [Mya arenaria]|uniref:uncharacterized protein LOC128225798 n=1 Tax=Mya arenaria TaxID=6604 RepID=UPI0022E5992B|nr:uncharacterized protein LOC128225798 [Mya arenaria]
MITDSFAKLEKGTKRHKDEDNMYHTLQEEVREYELRCVFERGRVSVLEDKVTVIIDQNTVGFEVAPGSISEMKQELTRLRKLTENNTRTYTNYSKMLKDHDSKRLISFADEEERLQKEFGRLQAEMIDNERKLAAEVDRLRKEHETLKAELTNIEIKLTSETKTLLIDRRMLEAEKDKLDKHLADKESELSKQNNELQLLKKNYNTSEDKCKEHEQTIARNNDKLEGMTRVAEKDIQNQCEIAKLKAEMQRLSKISGISLTYNRANIAGLGDLNRPSKLAEVFSEIYDNDWTDAYETVKDDEEKNKIQFMLKILKDVDIICENVAKRHADAITDGLTKMVVRFKVRKARTYPTLKFDERALKLVDTHIENPACTKDVLATGKFGDPSDVNKPIKHCNNDPSTPNKKTGEQGDAQASHENLAKENKSTNQSQSENGNKDNQLKPGKMETTDSKTTDERANQKTAPTINANINHTQGENGFHEKRLEPGDNDSSTSNKTDGKQTDETDTYQNLPSKIESTSNSKVIQDNGRNEQEHTEKEVTCSFMSFI